MFPPTKQRKSTLACVILGLSLCSGSPAGGKDPASEFGIEPEVVLEDRYPERLTRFADGVTGLADVTYSELPGFRPLTLDVYIPSSARQAQGGYPLVVFIHGGGWRGGHTRQLGAFEDWPGTLARVAADGYVVASVEYRLSGEAAFPAAFLDVRNAVRWLRRHAKRFHIDPGRVVAWGASAGGQLAALLGTACGDRKFEPSADQYNDGTDAAADNAECISGVVAWYGVLDLRNLMSTDAPAEEATVPPLVAQYLGCEKSACNIASLVAASPITYVDAMDPPFLLIHGSEDYVVPVIQSELMDAALADADVDSELVIIPDVQHSLIGSDAAETASASRLAIRKTMQFITNVSASSPANATANRR